MDNQTTDVGSTSVPGAPVEGWMLREDVVREVLARLARGEQVKAIARELGVDKKTINRRGTGPTVHGRARLQDAVRGLKGDSLCDTSTSLQWAWPR